MQLTIKHRGYKLLEYSSGDGTLLIYNCLGKRVGSVKGNDKVKVAKKLIDSMFYR